VKVTNVLKMTAEDKFTVSLIATCFLLPLACTSVACILRLTSIDNWFAEHGVSRAIVLLMLGVIIKGFSSVIGKSTVTKESQLFSCNLLLLLFVVLLILINEMVFALYIGFYTLIVFIHLDMLDDPDKMSYKFSFIVIGVSLLLYLITSYFGDLFSTQTFFDLMVGFMLLCITPTSIIRSFIMAEDVMDNKRNDPVYNVVRRKWLENPIVSGIQLVKLNFALCFSNIGEILQEVDVPNKK